MMADMQMFPETVEEYMEQYKMVDTENVYSNGIEYVPIFRMEQWFEHERAKHPERRKVEWTPCSERLPELVHKEGLLTGEKQLCTVKRTTRDGKYSGVFVQTEPVLFTEWSGWHLCEEDNNERYSTEVIAWMPWPEPYREEGYECMQKLRSADQLDSNEVREDDAGESTENIGECGASGIEGCADACDIRWEDSVRST